MALHLSSLPPPPCLPLQLRPTTACATLRRTTPRRGAAAPPHPISTWFPVQAASYFSSNTHCGSSMLSLTYTINELDVTSVFVVSPADSLSSSPTSLRHQFFLSVMQTPPGPAAPFRSHFLLPRPGQAVGCLAFRPHFHLRSTGMPLAIGPIYRHGFGKNPAITPLFRTPLSCHISSSPVLPLFDLDLLCIL